MSSEAPLDTAEIEAHLADLRRLYVHALPSQRLHVAKQRITHPNHDPNRLIAFVSAVEGFARSLCMHQHAKINSDLAVIYPKFEKRGAQSLIGEYLGKKGLGTPESHFGAGTWQLFGYAVQYRNLLAHECTYLGGDRSPSLIAACRKVLQTLAMDEGLNADDI